MFTPNKFHGLRDYTNKNTYINFEDDIDTQLCNLMGLSDIESQYVKDTVESIRRK